ncbi:MAG: ABC transporter permease [Thermoprotei archaeon]|nr:MAG: ABC transporter permease [Thermoprotei archaeon]RLF23034.1 MAG: ABC transporter permease [Thermoprotei archaeon]
MALRLVLEILRIKKAAVSIGVIIFIVLLGFLGPLFYKVDPTEAVGLPERPPSKKYPLGTNTFGQDILARVLHGIRTSLYIGTLAGLIALAIGTVVGAVAGYKGGFTDEGLTLVTKVLYMFPSILLMILIAAYVKYRDPTLVALIIGVTAWPDLALCVRSQILSLKEREFVYLSKMAGYSSIRVIIEDLIPNMLSYIFMYFVLLLAGAMLAEAGLSMIGVGITKGVSLGIVLYWAQAMDAVRRGLWWWFIPPGAILVAVASALLALSTALDEYFSPRLRGE